MPINPATRRLATAVRTTAKTETAEPPKNVTYGVNRRIDGLRADFNQGRTNACGTTALAVAFHHLGANIPRQTIDRSVRNFNLYSSSGGLIDYARQKGFQANRYENGSYEQLKSDLAAGRQVIVLTDVGNYDEQGLLTRGDESDLNLHYMNVTDVGQDQNGQRYVTYWTWGTEQTVPYERFEQMWSDLKIKGADSDWNRSYLLVDKGTAAPLRDPGTLASRQEDGVSDGVSKAANGAARIGRGEVWGGLKDIASGVGSTLKNAGALLVERLGRWF